VFLGVLFVVAFASLTNFVAPLVGVEQTEGFGPIFAFIMTGFIVYAVARYQLMDIIIVIKRTTLYALLTATITVSYIGVVILSNLFFGGIMGWEMLVPSMVAALLIAFAFAPLKEGIQLFIDKTLFKKRYDHRKILGDLSKVLTSIFSLEDLLALILRVLTEQMGITKGVIYLPFGSGDGFVPMAHQMRNGLYCFDRKIEQRHPLIRELMKRREVILREQLERMEFLHFATDIVSLLEKMEVDVCIPVFSKDELTGMLFLGSKETGEAFTREDIDMFATLSHQIAVAIDNARLYTKVEESKIYQEILVHSMTTGLIAIDLNKNITAFNQKAEEILHLSSQDVLSKDIGVLPPELGNVLIETLKQKGTFDEQEISLKNKERRSIPLAVSSSIFKNYEGKTLGALIVFTDLTDRKLLEAEVRRADRLASLGTLAAGMAHEIRNPLVSIKTFTQISPDNYDKKEWKDFAKLTKEEVERIESLIKKLMDFAHPVASESKPTDIGAILRDTLFLLKSNFNEYNIKVSEKISRRKLIAMVDGDQIKQVFLNLLLNAIQTMESSGGSIKVAASIKRELKLSGIFIPQDIIHNRFSDDHAEFAFVQIADTGPGIEEKDLSHLFDPFFTTKVSGSGLGLAIVHSIIKEHNGYIGVKSKLGKGTTFYIALPLFVDNQAGK
jgi:PAS domain S-box-containing protein